MMQIGIDLGGTNVAMGIVTQEGKILAKASIPTQVELGVDSILSRMAEGVKTLVSESNVSWEDISHVGIGSPGAVNSAKGWVRSACNLGFENLMLADRMSALLCKPVHVENDANCAAFAEAKVGAGEGCLDCLTVTLGTGIGGGIVINSKLYRGFNGFGGEFGHTIICHDGEPCACGKRGCFETYASATALIRETKRAAEQNPHSLLNTLAQRDGAFSGKTVFDGAAQGDETAKAVLDRYIEMLSVGIVNLIKIFQPERVIIGGGISHAGEALLTPLEKAVTSLAYRKTVPDGDRTRLCLAKLGNDAGIIGAALLCK